MKKVYRKQIKIEHQRLKQIEEVLNNIDNVIDDLLTDGVPEWDIESQFDEIEDSFTTEFEDGKEVVIKVCAGNPPYVDAVLFEGTKSLSICEPSTNLEGEFYFYNGNEEYIVNVGAK